jgi:hypothetical protein
MEQAKSKEAAKVLFSKFIEIISRLLGSADNVIGICGTSFPHLDLEQGAKNRVTTKFHANHGACYDVAIERTG